MLHHHLFEEPPEEIVGRDGTSAAVGYGKVASAKYFIAHRVQLRKAGKEGLGRRPLQAAKQP